MIHETFVRDSRSYYRCACDQCGVEFTRRTDYRSVELCVHCANKRGALKRSTHGHNNKNSRLHITWNNMLQRVTNPRNRKYPIYGGAGIKVFDAWLGYEGFRDWSMANGYADNLTLDRINPAGDYEPSNCRYVTFSEQNVNRRTSRKSSTGYYGVYRSGNQFVACVDWHGKRTYVGRFADPREASLARSSYIRANHLPHKLIDEADQELKQREAA